MIGVCGCASDPEFVYVDLDAVELRTVSSAPQTESGFVSQEIASSVTIDALDERSVFIGSSQDKAEEALRYYLETQEVAAAAVLKDLQEAYLAQVDTLQKEGEESLAVEYRLWLDSAFEELHTEFEVHADEVGKLWRSLSWRVGFPDPDPRSLAKSSDFTRSRQLAEAKELREDIRQRDTSFRDLVSEKIGLIQAERDRKLGQYRSEMDTQRIIELDRAKKEADAFTEQAFAILERSALDPEAQLPAVPRADSAVNSAPAPRWDWQKPTLPKETRDDLRTQLEIFLKVNGFKLADSREGAKDVTQEFVAWRRNYLAGR